MGKKYHSAFHDSGKFCHTMDFAHPTCNLGGGDLCRESGQTLQGLFSAVSKPILETKYAFESSRRDLQTQNPCIGLVCGWVRASAFPDVRERAVARMLDQANFTGLVLVCIEIKFCK